MPLFDGLVSGGEKTAIVIDLGAAYTKWVSFASTHLNNRSIYLNMLFSLLLIDQRRW